MNRSLYPDDWEKISLEIRNVAQWQCEKCGRPCRCPGQPWPEFYNWLLTDVPEPWFEQLSDEVVDEETGEWAYVDHPHRFTLTVAHLNHNPTNNVRSNLMVLCAPCHLAHDAHQYAQTRARKRYEQRELNGQLTLW